MKQRRQKVGEKIKDELKITFGDLKEGDEFYINKAQTDKLVKVNSSWARKKSDNDWVPFLQCELVGGIRKEDIKRPVSSSV